MTEYPPRVKKFLAEHPEMTFDEAYNTIEKKVKRLNLEK
jgi:hypothetical protein